MICTCKSTWSGRANKSARLLSSSSFSLASSPSSWVSHGIFEKYKCNLQLNHNRWWIIHSLAFAKQKICIWHVQAIHRLWSGKIELKSFCVCVLCMHSDDASSSSIANRFQEKKFAFVFLPFHAIDQNFKRIHKKLTGSNWVVQFDLVGWLNCKCMYALHLIDTI